MSYDNTNSGALFKNERKDKESQPDYRGTINVDGRELELAAWLKTSAKGVRFMSLKVQEPRAKAEERRDEPQEDPFGDAPF